jgi:hypothetical protein
MTLDVAICTFAPQGIERVAAMSLPRLDGVTYIVSWQQPGNAVVPQALLRDDVRIFTTDSIGLSKNRNHAHAHCTADVVLVADDDLQYTPQGLQAVIDTFVANPGVDVATFRYATAGESKIYPPTQHNLRTPFRFYYVTSFEIAFRRESITRVDLSFCELAGLGAPYLHAGEEQIFLHHCLKSGLTCVFFPLTIVTHAGLTTSVTRATDPGVIRARGAANRLCRGSFTALTRLPIEAFRTPLNPLRALLFLSQGYLYSLTHTL